MQEEDDNCRNSTCHENDSFGSANLFPVVTHKMRPSEIQRKYKGRGLLDKVLEYRLPLRRHKLAARSDAC